MKGDIEIISSTGKGMCGGTDAYIDWSLPKVISSEDMIFFKAESALNAPDRAERNIEPLGFVSAFAAPCGGGTFLFHEYGRGFSRYDERIFSLSLVKENVFPALCALVKRLDLAKDNGFHSKTHGLPENFGGSIDIKYSSGEKISISNNQSPVLSHKAGFEISQFFIKAMKGEKVALPDAKDLAVIRFDEERSDGGFTRAALTLNADGTTKVAGKLGALSASGSGYADVTKIADGVIHADFAPIVSVKDGKTTLKRALSIQANLWSDRSNDHLEGVGAAKIIKE